MRFLIVEDDLIYRSLLEDYLHPHGIVHTAVNGLEALQMIERALEVGQPYASIFLDIHLPAVDGHQVLESLRSLEERSGLQLGQGAQVVMMSSLGDKENVMRAFRSFCNHYLVKPYTREQVWDVLGIAS
jgi:two-component system chemotaxis response regulator CheY